MIKQTVVKQTVVERMSKGNPIEQKEIHKIIVRMVTSLGFRIEEQEENFMGFERFVRVDWMLRVYYS